MSILATSVRYTLIAGGIFALIGLLIWIFVGTPVMLIMAAVLIPGWLAICVLVRLVGGPE